MRQLDRLNARRVASLCKSNKPGRHNDGGGLYLQIRNGGQSWIFRYRRRHGTNSKGKKNALREMGLGPVASVSLADARTKAATAYSMLTGGDTDPLADRRTRRIVASKAKTFGVYVEEFLISTLEGFKNEKHRAQWGATLRTYAKPIWLTPLQEITTADIKVILDPIWHTKKETARRVRGRIERVLASAKAVGLRDGDNPARWRDNLQAVYGPQTASKDHHAAIAFADMPAFMDDLRKLASTSARALEFTILTAARTGEVRGARWSEVPVGSDIWIVPGHRMKAGKEHRVPLCARALAILKAMKRGKPDALIFPGAKPGEPLSDAALLMCLRGLRAGVTTHGFRSSFKDWATEGKPGFPNWLSELALAHTIKDRTEAAYRRGDALEMRVPMMVAWESYLAH